MTVAFRQPRRKNAAIPRTPRLDTIGQILREGVSNLEPTPVTGSGTRESPWSLKIPPGTSDSQTHRDESSDPPTLVCVVGKTELRYQLRCLEDLHAMLEAHGDWMPLGSADKQKPAAEG